MKQVIDLGWANGWYVTPEPLVEGARHNWPTRETYHHECETHFECETPTSIIKYKVDSSD